jgi:16S rRNA (cytosine1402-N4)-methyltransferase
MKEFLQSIYEVLRPGGRVVILTYHSLEDRMVKNIFKTGNIIGEHEKDFYGNIKTYFNILTKRAITASRDEQIINTRSRSAKLRVAEKIHS